MTELIKKATAGMLDAEEIQKKLVSILQAHDALRFRNKVQRILESIVKGEIEESDLGYELFTVTGLSLKETDKLAIALLHDFLEELPEQITHPAPAAGTAPSASISAARTVP